MRRLKGRFLTLISVILVGSQVAYSQTTPGDPTVGDHGVTILPSHTEPSSGPSPDPIPADVVVLRGGRTEFIALGPRRDSQAAIDALTAAGATLLRRRTLGTFRSEILAFDLRNVPLPEAQDILDANAPRTAIDVHTLYYFSQAKPRLFAASMVGVAAQDTCRADGLRIGVIDGAIDTNHPALQRAKITTASTLFGKQSPAKSSHGTSVAALMVGEDPAGFLNGYAQGAHLFAASAFTAEPRGHATNVERIAAAVDWMVANRVQVVNMSFAGPSNSILENVLENAASRGVIMVGAAGNKSKASVAFPAASPHVIAVTAVDAAARRYRKANRGAALEFAAPGVDIYVAQGKTGSYATGTSFAAPIVSAFAAREVIRGASTTNAVRAALRRQTQDLGAAGRDKEYGWGLVKANGGC